MPRPPLPPDEVRSKLIQIRFQPGLVKRIDFVARRNGETRTAWFERLARAELDKEGA